MDKKRIGDWGEARAAEHLERKGYEVIATGFRSRFGEIDLIAVNAEFVAFVEVKTRKDARIARAREFVDRRKQERLRQTAEIWLCENETGLQPRFDVIEVYAPQGVETKTVHIVHWENTF